MKQWLDDMTAYFDGGGSKYDEVYFQKLLTCMNKYDDNDLVRSQDSAWKGITDYYKSNGTNDDYMHQPDHWGGCTVLNPDQHRCNVSLYAEFREGKQDFMGEDKVLIYEPCNYASNIAYYHSTTRICDYPDWSIDEAF